MTPEVPAVPRPVSTGRGLPDAETMLRDVLRHRGWSVRAGQLEMVQELDSEFRGAVRQGGVTVRAPVGIGKTLAYLIAALVGDGRTIVCTSTKALQDQVATVELPRLARDVQELYGYQLTFAVLKGKSNYVCLEAADSLAAGRSPDDDGLFEGLSEQLMDQDHKLIREMTERTRRAMAETDPARFDCGDLMSQLPTGFRRNLHAGRRCGMRSRRWWEAVDEDDLSMDLDEDTSLQGVRMGDRYAFPPQEILAESTCAYRSAYAHALTADVVVMNTSLLAAELQRSMVAGAFTPQQLLGCDLVIVDEAHHLVRILTDSLSSELDMASVTEHCDTHLRRLMKRRPDLEDILQGYSRILERAEQEMVDVVDGESGRKLRTLLSDKVVDLAESLVQLTVGTTGRSPDMSDADHKKVAKIVAALEEEVVDHLRSVAQMLIMEAPPDDEEDPAEDTVARPGELVYDVTFKGGFEDEHLLVNLVPLDLSFFYQALMGVTSQPNLYVDASRTRKRPLGATSLGLCSGTLTRSAATLVGMHDAEFVSVESPFDPLCTRICIPAELPLPADTEWVDRAWEVARQAIVQTGGRTLFLCTSTNKVTAFANLAFRDLEDHGISVLYQGNGLTRSELVERFTQDETSVLVGTTSFWEGVDVTESACSLVVIDRIPFPTPDDPVFQARKRYVKRNGGDDFEAFMAVDVDYASIMMAQGVGRLIRSQNDVGGVLILDPRLLKVNKRYGSSVLKLIPGETPISSDLAPFLEWLGWVNPDTRDGRPMPAPEMGNVWFPLRPPRPARRRRG